LTEWGMAGSPIGLRTRSGRSLEVQVRKEGSVWNASLRGPAEIVFVGQLREIDLSRAGTA
jgi:diaminopimelate epimerase